MTISAKQILSSGDFLRVEVLREEGEKRIQGNPFKWIRMPDGRVRLRRWNKKQQDAIRASESGDYFVVAMLGANQFGKSKWASADCVAKMCGIPISKWPELPDELKREHLGKDPKRIWAVTTTYAEASVSGQQSEMDELLPNCWIRRGTYQRDTGYSNRMVILHNGSEMRFKSSEQGKSQFEQVPVDRVWWDEIQDIPETFYTLTMARIVAKKGDYRVTGISASPWVIDRFIHRRLKPDDPDGTAKGVYTVCGQMRDNAALSKSAIEDIESHWPEDVKRLRSLGIPTLVEGLVYPGFGQHNTVQPFRIRFNWPPWSEKFDPTNVPAEKMRELAPWTPYEAIDPGFRNPYAVVFAAVNPDGNMYIYDELYEVGRSNEEMAEMILRKRARHGYEKPALAVIDVAAHFRDSRHPSSHRNQLFQAGITTVSRKLDKSSSRGKLQKWMKPAGFPGVRPRLYVFATCRHWLREVRVHRHKAPDDLTGQYLSDREAVIEADDHLLDATRYLVDYEPGYRPQSMPAPPANSMAWWATHREISASGSPMQLEVAGDTRKAEINKRHYAATEQLRKRHAAL